MQLLKDHDEINLLEAAQDGKLDFIQEQLSSLLNDRSKSNMLEGALTKQDFYGRNALHYAAYRGHADVVQYFLELKSPYIKINCRDNQGNTPLMLACVRGYNTEASDLIDGTNRKYLICKMLIDQGADLKIYSKEGINNPLHWTCYFGDILSTKLLIDRIPGLMLLRNDHDYFPIDHTLMSSKEQLDSKQDQLVAEFLILTFLVHYLESSIHRINLDEIDRRISPSNQNMEPRENDLLIQSGEIGLNFVSNKQTRNNQIHINVVNTLTKQNSLGKQQVMVNRILKKYKSDKRFDLMGHRYLYWASVMGREDIAISLIHYQYSPFVMSYKGRNSVHAAAFHNHLHLLRLFFESEITRKQLNGIGGIKRAVNLMTTQQPETALHIAIQQGNQEVVNYLYQMGADPEIHNFRNLTAFETTRDNRVKQIKQNILKQSSDFKRNLVRQGYKYILIGREYLHQKDDLLFQQLINIQEKNINKGKCKVLILKNYENTYQSKTNDGELIPGQDNLVYYLLKISDSLMNEIADEERLMVYNLREGFICRFLKQQSEVYENFHNRQVQQIMLKLMNDEFDLEQFVNDGIVVDHFPLHDFEEKRSILQFWQAEKWTILKEPFKVDKISIRTINALQSYYGAEVGFFFVFLTFFTSWLFLPAIPGIMLGIYSLVSGETDNAYVPIYIIFLAVWATIFFEFWKRKQNEMAFEFDMHITKEEKKKIPQYKGQFSVEDVTHEIVIVDKRSELWKYIKSTIPLIMFGLSLIAGQFLLFHYLLDFYAHEFYPFYYVSVAYGLSIILSNELFYYLTRLSLNYENHQFEDDKENVYILKVFSFTFLNNYIRLFYRSIIQPDSQNTKELEILTTCFTLVWATVHFIRFNLLPIIVHRYVIPQVFARKFAKFTQNQQKILEGNRKKIYTLSSNKLQLQEQNSEQSKSQSLVEKNISEGEQLKLLEEIEQTRLMMVNSNYIEQFTYLIIQFGNVAMFSSNFQLVPTIIMIMNWLNIESIFYSYVHFVKRPIATPKKGIGLWNDILLVVGYIATVINCLTIYQAKQEQLESLIGKSQAALTNFLLLIAAEHIVIGIKFIIESVIPDVPDWVEDALKRQDYLEEQWHLKMKVEEQVHDHTKQEIETKQQQMIE